MARKVQDAEDNEAHGAMSNEVTSVAASCSRLNVVNGRETVRFSLFVC